MSKLTLNKQQLQAVTHPQGSLLIVAGAGTGKTTVITERIKHLIQKKKVDPNHIFAATFTQKSADEMLERLDQVMPLGYQEPWLGTFHSLCDRLLRLEGLEIGLNPNFTIMTQTDQWIFLKSHLFDFDLDYYRPLGNPNKFISALIKLISRLQDEDTQAEEFLELASLKTKQAKSEDELIAAKRLQELARAYQTYIDLKQTASAMDFGDLITYTLKLLRERPNLAKNLKQQFQHVLVDEFQDTNYAQFALIKLLAPPQEKPNLMVVGDDDQSIYKFRGASVSNILEFKDLYPQAREIVLTQNYRSTQAILDSAYQIIQHNNPDRLEVKLNVQKKLRSQQKTQHHPRFLHFATLDEEVEWTVNQIVELVTKEGLTYQDIAILTRSNSQLEPYALALRNAGLPYQLISNRGLFDQPEVKDLITFLRVLADPQDAIPLFSLTQTPTFSLKPAQILALLSKAKSQSIALYELLQTVDESAIKYLIETIKTYQGLAATLPVSRLLYQFVEDTGYLKPYIKQETLENQLKIRNLNLFFQQLKRFEHTTDHPSLLTFLDVLELWLEAGENPGQAQIEDVDTISLMTVHAAKGLEFDAVFVGSLVAGRFPTYNRRDPIEVPEKLIKETLPEGDEHLQEERRLFYVALTRAKRFLYLSFAEDLGGLKKRKMSGFLAETGFKPEKITVDTLQLSLLHAKEPPYLRHLKSGDYIIDHVSFSQIDTFKLCPLKYKYRYLLQIPARPHHSLSFGRTIHQTLHQFHQLEMQGKKLKVEELLDIYQKNFIDEGYDSQEHKQKRFDSGRKALQDYYQKHQELLGKPQLLERKFTLNLNGTKLIGKIDRIDKTKDGQLELVDYKTGSRKDQKAVDKDDQLTIYSLAAREALNLKIERMSLYFLEGGGDKVTTTRSPEDLTKARQKLIRQINQIKTSDFPAKPNPVVCGFCEYVELCPFAAKPKN